MTFRIAHLSDLHLTGTEEDRDFLHGVFRSAVEYGVDHVLVTGDISDGGQADAFRVLDEKRREFGFGPARSTIIPGNHDLPGRRAFMRRFGREAFVARRLAGGRVLLTSIDSTGHDWDRFHNPRGWFTQNDFDQLDRQLRVRRTPVTLVALHHHLIDVPNDSWYETPARWVGQWGPVEDADALFNLMFAHGVDGVLSGHVHTPYRHIRRRQGHTLQCFIAGATRVQRGYRLLDIDDGGLHDAGRVTLCETCDHLGVRECDECDEDSEVECESCDGVGASTCPRCDGQDETCAVCDRDYTVVCEDCGGRGWVACGECAAKDRLTAETAAAESTGRSLPWRALHSTHHVRLWYESPMRLTSWAGVVVLLGVGCGSGMTNACAPGAQAVCACSGSAPGIQVCKSDGTGFGACIGCAGADLSLTVDMSAIVDFAVSPDLSTPDLSTPDLVTCSAQVSSLTKTGTALGDAGSFAGWALGAQASVEFWARPLIASSDDNAQMAVSTAYDDSTTGGWYCYATTNQVSFALRYADSSTLLTATIAPSLNVWHHYACEYDGSTMRVFLDGALVGSKSASGSVDPYTAHLLVLNRNKYSSANTGAYAFRQIRVGNKAVYSAPFTPAWSLAPATGTVALYRADEGSGVTLASTVSGPAAITVSGATSWMQYASACN